MAGRQQDRRTAAGLQVGEVLLWGWLSRVVPAGATAVAAAACPVCPLTCHVEGILLSQPPPRLSKLVLGVPVRPLRLICTARGQRAGDQRRRVGGWACG